MTEKNTKDKSRRQEDRDSTALAIPESGISRIFEDFMKPFDEFMGPLFPGSMRSLWTELGEREPNIDIHDRGDHFVLTAEMPGFDKNEVEVRVSDNVLELKAEKKSENESESDGGIQRQSSYSYFHKYLTLPEQVLSEKVDGTMKNGVLELRLPKTEPKPRDRSKRVDLK